MNFNRVFAITLRQFYLMRGSYARFVPLFLWVAIDIILWGYMTKFLNRMSHTDYDFVPALLGAVLLWDFLSRVLQGVTIAFFEDVWSRNLLNVFASPLNILEYQTGLVLSSIATSSIGLVVMLLLSSTIFGLDFATFGLNFIPFILILFMFGIALGVGATAMVLRLGPASEWFVWPIPAMIAPFVGVYYPISTLPSWMQLFAKVLPPTYVFESLRALVTTGHTTAENFFFGFGLATFYIVMASWLFNRTFRHALNTGLIARYSAESVS
jgi:ABC-2 type transport system permease protein